MTAEEATFRAFVVPKKRERYGELLQTKPGREKIRLSLDHFEDLDPTFWPAGTRLQERLDLAYDSAEDHSFTPI